MKHSKYIVSPLRFFLLLAVAFLFAAQFSWAVSSSDYSSLNGTSGTTLWSAVHTKAKSGYSSLSYAGLWNAYKTSDIYPTNSSHPDYDANKAGMIWDLYGGCAFTAGTDQCGSYTNECDCYNREHSIPKSWFGGSESSNTPGTDIFHVVPTDGKINNTRQNYAFGEVATAKTTHNTNGLVNKLSTAGGGKSITITNTMLGTSSTQSPGSSKQVFEPPTVYKGDFARGYFGTLLKWAGDYQAFTTGDGSVMFSGTYTEAGHWGLTPYGIALLLKWHREDPVSQKEIDRNNGIESTQGNRNPFIDYPILAEYIWGKYAGNEFNTSNAVGSFEPAFTPGVSDGDKATGPTITINPSSLTMDATAVNGTTTKTFTITGTNLTGAINISVSGSYYSVSQTTIAAGSANGTNTITVTYHPTATGVHTATFTIASTGATSKTVTVSGTCTTVHTATWMANGSQYHQNTAADGSAPSVPEAPDDCGDDRVFMGWTDNENYSGSGSGLFTDEAPTMNTDKTFYAVYADKETSGGGGSSSSASYSFSDKSWAASPSNWTSGKDGNGFSNSGVQVTTGVSGANATCPTSYSSISSIVISYCTNASKGAGSIQMTVGSTSVSNNVSTSGGTTARDLTFDFSSTKPSGAPKITVTCTTNSIYICGVTITYGGGGSTTYCNYSTQCTACTPVAATASYVYPTKTTTCGGSVSNTFTTNSNATVSYASSNTSVATVASDGTVTPLSAGTTTITATVPANTCFTGGASASYTLTVYNFNAAAATDVTCNSFTANWTSAGAASYSLDVFQETTTSEITSRDTTIAYDFTGGMYWTANDVFGTSNIWTNSSTYGNVGKGKSGTASESWLISPELDFSDVTTASLTMNHTFRYGESSQLSVKYSTDGGSTWSSATLSNWGSSDSWTFVDASANLSATCGSAHVKLAFVYTCTASSYSTWEIKSLNISGTYNKTTTTSSIEHVSGYPKNVTGTSASVTTLDPTTTYYYTVTPSGGSVSNQIEVTTSACTCTYTITATTDDDAKGTVSVTTP